MQGPVTSPCGEVSYSAEPMSFEKDILKDVSEAEKANYMWDQFGETWRKYQKPQHVCLSWSNLFSSSLKRFSKGGFDPSSTTMISFKGAAKESQGLKDSGKRVAKVMKVASKCFKHVWRTFVSKEFRPSLQHFWGCSPAKSFDRPNGLDSQRRRQQPQQQLKKESFIAAALTLQTINASGMKIVKMVWWVSFKHAILFKTYFGAQDVGWLVVDALWENSLSGLDFLAAVLDRSGFCLDLQEVI